MLEQFSVREEMVAVQDLFIEPLPWHEMKILKIVDVLTKQQSLKWRNLNSKQKISSRNPRELLFLNRRINACLIKGNNLSKYYCDTTCIKYNFGGII